MPSHFWKGISESALPTWFHLGKWLDNHHSKLHIYCLWGKPGFKCHSLQFFSQVVWTHVLIEGLLKRILILVICLGLSTANSENRNEISSFNAGLCVTIVLRIMLLEPYHWSVSKADSFVRLSRTSLTLKALNSQEMKMIKNCRK